ncbi:hypothetical protein QEH52_14100 [Coraliomargarita sp. SDUM461003]|uniref:Uncharacterized protein n=1 Tax=Thalassobacterium maritimum TaxID=3041265 RepID=A0ABU1AWX5_9BACT|nr:hypothetical protein [Coraliomargarita sp. SDUM461003]MDQ8208654.1 hypothetical protein [Coraliomargarita sp. SDUM461003]
MKKYFFPILTLLAGSLALNAQEAIKVDRVDFKSLRDDWIQMEIELSCTGNPAPDARDRNYVEAIKVKAYLAYERDAKAREYDYYTSEAEIIIMEKGDDNNVYFYLPGLIAERDQLQTDPDFYYVEVSVNGEPQKPQTAAMSSNIPNLDILNSFVSKADSEGADNEHLLMPIYLVSGIDLGRVSDLPAFLRRDVRD